MAPGRRKEPFEGIFRIERIIEGEEREPSWHAGDGLHVLNP
jgi:hypothetical protein